MLEFAGAPRTLLITDLVGREVQTAEGHTLGRVFELRVSSGSDFGVEALLLGGAGLAYRFDLSRTVFYHLRLGRKRGQVIRWSAVAAFDGKTLTLRAGWRPPHKDEAPSP